MDCFLETTDTIREGVGFQPFGTLHLCWMVGFLLFAIGMGYVYRKADGKKRNKMRKIIAALIVADELWKMFWLTVGGNYTVDYLPLHLCSINIFIIAYHVFKPNEVIDNFLYSICLPGAVAAILAPTWVKLPLWNFMHLHSFTVHILLATYPIMLVAGGDIVPDIHKIPQCILFTLAMAVPIYFVNLLLDTNFMFLMSAEPGNPLYWFKQTFGFHLLGVPVIEMVVLFVLYGPLYLLKKVKSSSLRLNS